ncbi:LAGLIDADG family homing endonuclease, partial [Salmonella enterica subsp. enterica serovar Paratyphi A]
GNSYGDNSKFSKADAYGRGLMVADGCYHNDSFNFTNNEPVLIDYIDKWFTKLTGIAPRIDERIRNGKYISSGVHIRVGQAHQSYVISNKEKLTQQLELGNHLAGTKEVPNSILTSPKEIQLAFLSGYFECEMNYNMTGGRLGIEITSKSQKLILQVQLMLINMGVLSKIRSRRVKGFANTYYVLGFWAIDGFNLLNLLSFKTDSRQDQKESYIKIFKSKHRNPKGRFVPNGKQLFHEYYKTLP